MVKEKINFNRGVPPAESFPSKKIVQCLEKAIQRDGDSILQYGSSAGYPPLIEWVAEKYGVDTNQVVMGQGSLQLLDILVKTSFGNQNPIFVEQPTYDRTLTIFRRAGVKVKGFRLESGRMDFEEIEAEIHKNGSPKFFYIIPDFQNPNGSVMPLEDRERMVRMAEEYSFTIIEDGPYRELRYGGEALPSIHQLAPKCTIHMSSLSKLISPGMRIGYMVASAETSQKIRQYAEDTYISPNLLSHAAAYEFIRNGWLDEHLTLLLNLYRKRRDALQSSLAGRLSEFADWTETQGGFFIGVFLKGESDLPNNADYKKAGLLMSRGTAFFLEGGENFIRLPFCALDENQISEGIIRLRKVLDNGV